MKFYHVCWYSFQAISKRCTTLKFPNYGVISFESSLSLLLLDFSCRSKSNNTLIYSSRKAYRTRDLNKCESNNHSQSILFWLAVISPLNWIIENLFFSRKISPSVILIEQENFKKNTFSDLHELSIVLQFENLDWTSMRFDENVSTTWTVLTNTCS